MAVNYDEVVSSLARDLASAGEDIAAKGAIVERYEHEHPGLRAWFTEMIVKLTPILARQREMERRLAELEAHVEEIKQLSETPTLH